MADILLLSGLVLAGWVLGYLYNWLVEKGESVQLKQFESLGRSPNLVQFLAEILYFAMLFSVPLSGNIPLTGIMLALFLYAVFGSFGGIPKDKMPEAEDMVTSKWHKMFP